MIKVKKLIIGLLGAALFSAAASCAALADTRIKFVRVSADYEPLEGRVDASRLSFTPQNKGYTLEYTIDADLSEIGVGDRFQVTLVLTAGKRYNFQDIKAASCLIQNDENSKLTNLEISEDDTVLKLTYDMAPLRMQLEQPGNPVWAENLHVSWDPVEYSSGYIVNVYSITTRGELRLADKVEVDGKDTTTADVKPILLKNVNDYTFSVVAVPSEEDYYLKDSEESFSPLSDSHIVGQTEIGYNSGYFTRDSKANRYYVVDKQALADGIYLIEGYNYCFNEEGIMQFGFQQKKNSSHVSYFDPDGKMLYGWIQTDDGWYYADPTSGIIMTGMKTIEGKKYYLDPDSGGRMTVGWKEIGGKLFYFSGDGIMNTQKLMDQNNRVYIFKGDGSVDYSYQAK